MWEENLGKMSPSQILLPVVLVSMGLGMIGIVYFSEFVNRKLEGKKEGELR
jgi:hypothetical protein